MPLKLWIYLLRTKISKWHFLLKNRYNSMQRNFFASYFKIKLTTVKTSIL